MEMIQEEATTADNCIKTKRKLMRYGLRVESSAQSPSLSEGKRGKAANDHSGNPWGTGGGKHMTGPCVQHGKDARLWFKEVTQALREDEQIVGLFAAPLR